jgi:hypothetical protein
VCACRIGDESQQPTCPQVRHSRRCTHGVPRRRHSAQPSGVVQDDRPDHDDVRVGDDGHGSGVGSLQHFRIGDRQVDGTILHTVDLVGGDVGVGLEKPLRSTLMKPRRRNRFRSPPATRGSPLSVSCPV